MSMALVKRVNDGPRDLAPAAPAGPTFEQIQQLAVAVARSGLFACKTPDQALTLMMLCQAEGMHPITAMRTYHLIQGRPTMRADAIQARFQARGGVVKWLTRTEEEVEAEFSHPQGGTVRVKWTIEMARKAKLAGKDTWQQYPRQMLTARVVSEGVRTVLPDVVVGLYTPEEAQDFGPMPVAPAAEEPAPPPPSRQEQQPDSDVAEWRAEAWGDECEARGVDRQAALAYLRDKLAEARAELSLIHPRHWDHMLAKLRAGGYDDGLGKAPAPAPDVSAHGNDERTAPPPDVSTWDATEAALIDAAITAGLAESELQPRVRLWLLAKGAKGDVAKIVKVTTPADRLALVEAVRAGRLAADGKIQAAGE